MRRHESGHRADPAYGTPEGRGDTDPPVPWGKHSPSSWAPACAAVSQRLSVSAHQVVGVGGADRGGRGRRSRQPAPALTAGHGGAQQGLEGTGVTAALQDGAQTDRHQPDRQRDPRGPGLTQVELDAGQGGKSQEDNGEEEGLAEVGRHGAATHVGGQPAQPRQPAIRPRSAGVQGQQRQPAAGPGHTRDRMKGHAPGGQGSTRGPHCEADTARGPDPQAAQADSDQDPAVTLGADDEVGVGQTGSEEHRRNDHGEEQRRDQASTPGQEALGDVGQDRVGRAAGPLVRGRRRGRALGGQEAAHVEEGGGAGNDDDDAEGHGPFPVLAGDPAGEDDGDQAVGADDVTGEEHGVHGAEEDHPQAPTPHQATCIDGGLLTGPGRLLRRRLTAVLHAGQGAEVGGGT